mmetsp:Transcript_1882/g.3620  ORF Transcript_1882/g.3620 Transcript_1882/m.3620 type:complete len:232 (-) Transcript_1882:752-1447(-)
MRYGSRIAFTVLAVVCTFMQQLWYSLPLPMSHQQYTTVAAMERYHNSHNSSNTLVVVNSADDSDMSVILHPANDSETVYPGVIPSVDQVSASLEDRWNACEFKPRLPEELGKEMDVRLPIGSEGLCTPFCKECYCRFAGRFISAPRWKIQYLAMPKVASTHLRKLILSLNANGKNTTVKQAHDSRATERRKGYFTFTFVTSDITHHYYSSLKQIRGKLDQWPENFAVGGKQ